MVMKTGMKWKDRAAVSEERTYFKQHFSISYSHEKKRKRTKKQPHETKNHTENKQNKGQSQKANHL